VLTRDERVSVQSALARVIARSDARTLITVIFTTEADSILLEMPQERTTPQDIAAFTMTACLISRWIFRPSLLEMLLDYLVAVQQDVRFSELLVRVQAGIDPNRTPYEASWLLNHTRPFFDRHDLRGQVRDLIEQNGQPILIVTAGKTAGENNSDVARKGVGLSYTGRFFEHLQDSLTVDFHVLVATISKDSGPTYQIEDLLEDLSAQFPRSEAPPERASSSYPEAVARWLLRQMIRNGGLWLILLDGFGQRPLNDEVRLAVEALARRVTIGAFRFRIRLVLLGYPHPLPQVDPAEILYEELPPAADLCPADLLPCLTAWDTLRREKGLPGAPSDVLDELARDLATKAPAAGRARLENLNAELIKLLRKP
jgi:hypothetical protein